MEQSVKMSKWLLLVFAIVLTPLIATGQAVKTGANNYYIYSPLEYSPAEYIPLSTDVPRPRTIPYGRYEYESPFPICVERLIDFVEESLQFSGIEYEYIGDWSEYVNLASKYKGKKRLMSLDLSNKRQMSHFVDDWKILQGHIRDAALKEYEDQVKKQMAARKEILVKDSLAAREKFVADSILARNAFVTDSTNYRRQFVHDSLYRAGFLEKNKNKYDNVVFDGRCNPIACYRNGRIIDGHTINRYGLKEDCYENGKLVHKFAYSAGYLYHYGLISKNDYNLMRDLYARDLRGESSIIKEDSVRQERYFFLDDGSLFYISFEDMGGLLSRIEYYNNGERVKKETKTYYQDKKTVKTKETIEYPSEKKTIEEYYSSGQPKSTKNYEKRPGGRDYIPRKIRYYEAGHSRIEEYDFEGKLERSYVSYPLF